MSQETEDRLSDPALLSSENVHARMINIAKINDVFAEEKARKTKMSWRSFKWPISAVV